MCVIVHCEKAKPPLADLEKMARRNSAGAGLAWFEGGRVHWNKGLGTASMVEALLKDVPLPCVIHFRLATVGGQDMRLTHPFPMTEKSELFLNGNCSGAVLFHNGHCSDWKLYLKLAGIRKAKEPMSDTRALAMVGGKTGEWQFLRELNGDGVFAVMESGKVHRIGSWVEDKQAGIHYSNKFWNWESAGTASSFRGGCGSYDEDWHGSAYTGHIAYWVKADGVYSWSDTPPRGYRKHSLSCGCNRCDAWWEEHNPGKKANKDRPGWTQSLRIRWADEDPKPEEKKTAKADAVTQVPIRMMTHCAGIMSHDIRNHVNCECWFCSHPYDKGCQCQHCIDRRAALLEGSKKHKECCNCECCRDRKGLAPITTLGGLTDKLADEIADAREQLLSERQQAELEAQRDAYEATGTMTTGA